MRLIMVMALGLCAGLFAGGCGYIDLDNARGTNSLIAAFAPPSPSKAATWAVDPYNADNRYRGTILLANSDFAGQAPYVELFLDATQDESPNVRAAGVRGLANHGRPEHASVIAARMDDEDRRVRLEASRGLQRLHDPVVVDRLLNTLGSDRTTDEGVPLLNEPDNDVRAAAAHALGQYAEPRVLPVLIAALADHDLIVNRNALASLRTLTGEDYGFDRRAWLGWYDSETRPFAGRTAYYYPVFWREAKLIEQLPIIPGPPNEPEATPIGMPPLDRQRPPEFGPETDPGASSG